MSERLIPSKNVVLWSEDFGNPADPDVILIMGANSSAMGWPNEFVELLVAGGRHVIRYDHRDTGLSTTREFTENPYTVEDLAADAIAIMDGWDVESAHVVGFSLGTTLGQVLALDYPERLHTLTLMAGTALDVDFVDNIRRAYSGEPSSDGLPIPRKDVLDVLAQRATPVDDQATELDRRIEEWRALSGSQLPFDANEFRRWEERAIAHAGTLRQPFAHAMATPVPTTRGAELGRITTPTLVIQAPLDPLNPPPHAQHIADLIPNAQFVEIPGMGHALPSAVHAPVAAEILKHTAKSVRSNYNAIKQAVLEN